MQSAWPARHAPLPPFVSLLSVARCQNVLRRCTAIRTHHSPSTGCLPARLPPPSAGCRRWASRRAPRTPPPRRAPSRLSCSVRRPRAAPTTWRRSRRHWGCGTAQAPLCSPLVQGYIQWRTGRVGGCGWLAPCSAGSAALLACLRGIPLGATCRPCGLPLCPASRLGSPAAPAGRPCCGHAVQHPSCLLLLLRAVPASAPCSLRRDGPDRQAGRQRAHRQAAGGGAGGSGGGRLRGAAGGPVPRPEVSRSSVLWGRRVDDMASTALQHAATQAAGPACLYLHRSSRWRAMQGCAHLLPAPGRGGPLGRLHRQPHPLRGRRLAVSGGASGPRQRGRRLLPRTHLPGLRRRARHV